MNENVNTMCDVFFSRIYNDERLSNILVKDETIPLHKCKLKNTL